MNNIDQTLQSFNDSIKALIDVAHQPVAQEVAQFLEFRAKKGTDNYGKGIIWSGQGYTKQFVFNPNPDRFFSTESIDLDRGKSLSIGGSLILNETTLGPSITKSNLQSLGRLKGLIVDGSLNVNQYMIYNGATDRLGLGTDAPNGALAVAEMGIEVVVGTSEELHGMIGTYAATDFDIVTDNTARITVAANGNVQIGNLNRNPVQVSINGKLSIGVKNPDPSVDLHVAGGVRFSGHVQKYAEAPPAEGTYAVGDIIWNSNPRVGVGVGWVCLRAGSPGSWYPFGEIKERG